MRTVLAVAAIAVSSVGYFLGPAVALPRDCIAEQNNCEFRLTGTVQKNVAVSICSAQALSCKAENTRNGYTGLDQLGPDGASKEPEKKKPTDWKIRVGTPHVANPTKSGSVGSNAQLGIKATTPTTAATATSTAPTLPPKPSSVSNEAIAKRVGAGRL